MQKEELTNAGRHNLHKPADEKRSIAESMHTYVTRARLTACEVGIFSREISQLSKILPPLLFEEVIKSMGVFSRDYYIRESIQCSIESWCNNVGSGVEYLS